MMTVCVVAMVAVIESVQPKLSAPLREWIGHNVCNAAHDTATDPVWLGAYMLTENRMIDLWAVVPASCGNDHSLFQINSCYQKGRADFRRIHHPYYGAKVAAEILQDNLKAFGWTWQAFAAYWNPSQARQGTLAATRYYARYHANAQLIERAITTARKQVDLPKPEKNALFFFESGVNPPNRFTPPTISG